MADNTTLNSGSGGDVIATDDISGVKYQRVKPTFGVDGSATDASIVNPFPVTIPGAVDEFDALVTGQRVNQVEVIFAGAGTASTVMSITNTGSGTNSWTAGQCTFSTGVTNPSTVDAVTPTSVVYRTMSEVYAVFTAAYTTGVVSTFQRVGQTDKVDGVWIGYEGSSFGISYSKNSAITSVDQASWNGDKCQGAATSLFTSGGTPVSLDPTKNNIYRIRYGWLGIGPINYEVLSPDGVWVLLHQVKFPNTQTGSHIRTPNLPMRVWLSSVGTNLAVAVGSLAAGCSSPMVKKGEQPLQAMPVQRLQDSGRTNIVFYAVAAAAGTTGTETAISLTKSAGTAATSAANSHVVTSGKRLRLIALSVATRGHNTATAQSTTFNLRINTAGAVTTTSTPIILAARSATPATANAWDRVSIPLGEGYEIAGDGTLQIGITAAATYTTNAPTWDVTLIGYEY